MQMAHSAPSTESKGNTGDDNDRTPRWVKVFGSIVIVLILLFVIMHLTGVIGHHGPSRHMPSAVSGGDTRH
jgi:hypothetical protein